MFIFGILIMSVGWCGEAKVVFVDEDKLYERFNFVIGDQFDDRDLAVSYTYDKIYYLWLQPFQEDFPYRNRLDCWFDLICNYGDYGRQRILQCYRYGKEFYESQLPQPEDCPKEYPKDIESSFDEAREEFCSITEDDYPEPDNLRKRVLHTMENQFWFGTTDQMTLENCTDLYFHAYDCMMDLVIDMTEKNLCERDTTEEMPDKIDSDERKKLFSIWSSNVNESLVNDV